MQNSLFEDNAEFGLGMKIGSDRARETVANLMTAACDCDKCPDEVKALFRQWLENKENGGIIGEVADKVIPTHREDRLPSLQET